METHRLDEPRDAGPRISVLPLEIEQEVSNGQEHVEDKVLKGLSPLVNCMRVFGLFFTSDPRSELATTSRLSQEGIKGCRGWNPTRVYATVLLVVTWTNAVRYCMVFEGRESLGPDLFMKLLIIPSALLTAILHTAYFIANVTGSLNRVLRQAILSTDDFSPSYSRRAKVVTVICWLIMASTNIYYVYMMFARGQFNDPSLLLLIKTYHISETDGNIMKGFFVALQLQAVATCAFTQAMRYTVVGNIVYSQTIATAVFCYTVYSLND